MGERVYKGIPPIPIYFYSMIHILIKYIMPPVPAGGAPSPARVRVRTAARCGRMRAVLIYCLINIQC